MRAHASVRTIAPTVKPLVLAVALALAAAGVARAAPANGLVVFGNAQFSQPASGTTQITQTTGKAIINWDSFSIGAGETVRFQQPAASSIALNRVVGADPSMIMGNLTANGKVFLVNQNGILFGAQSRVDVGSLVASTLDINDADFVAGTYRFSGTSTASVRTASTDDGSQQRARLTAAEGGTIALLGATVTNNGSITARMGTVGLASGASVTLDFAGDGLTQITVSPASIDALVQNGGAIIADGGQVILRADVVSSLASAVVNQTGALQANAVALSERNGKLILDAGASGTVNAGGTITAQGTQPNQLGGDITLRGHTINMNGLIDASGGAGGGTISAVGASGDFDDSYESIALNNGASLLATATNAGAGGRITLSDTGFIDLVGTANVKGGAQGGAGGLVQTNGTYVNAYDFAVTGTSVGGAAGTWSLDTSNVVVNADLASSIVRTLDTNTNVVVNTHIAPYYDGRADIVVASPIRTRGVAALSFNSAENIIVNDEVEISAYARISRLDVNLNAGAHGNPGAIAMLPGSSITTNGGAIALYGNSDPVHGAATGNDAFPNGVLLDGVILSADAEGGGAGGSVTIRGTGTRGSTGGGQDRYAGPVGGVVMANDTSVSSGGDISITGTSYVAGGVGVNMSAGLQSNGGNLAITGLALEQADTGVLLQNTGIGGFNRILVAGRGTTGPGVQLNNAQLGGDDIVVAGESAGAAPGLGMSGGWIAAGDVAISALNNPQTSGGVPMITTDASNPLQMLVAGTVNFHPGGVDATGALVAALDVPIAVGSTLYPFQVDLGAFGLGAESNPYGSRVVIGSGEHRGAISFSDANTFYGNLTLENGSVNSQGMSTGNSQGITLTGPLTATGMVALWSGGPLTGTEFAIAADSLLLVLTQQNGGNVTLTNPGNRFNNFSAVYTAPNASLDVYDSVPLTIGGAPGAGYYSSNGGLFAPISNNVTAASGDVRVRSAGGLMLRQDIASFNAGIELVTGTVFDNSARVALTTAPGYAWNIYADTWVGENRNGLAPAAVKGNYYNCGYDAGCRLTQGAGDNHFIYRAQPTLVVTPDVQSRVYGDNNPALTYTATGLVNGDSAAGVAAGNLATTATNQSNVGAYAVTGSITSPVGYAISVQPGTLTVNPAALLIKADDQAKVYGGADPLLTATYTGLKLGQTAVAGLQLATTQGAAATAGTHAITASGAVNPNYSIMYQPGVLTVAKAALAVIAQNQQKVYGDADPQLTTSFAGLQYNDTPAVVTNLAVSTTTGAAATAGTHAIAVSGSGAANYDVTYQPGVLTVAKAALTVSADDKQKVFGAADPLLTASASGFRYTDTAAVLNGLVLNTTTGAAATAGTHAITASGAAAANYDVTYRPGILSVSKAALTVAADDKNKVYGGADPLLTASAAGLQYNDTTDVVTGLTLATTTGAAATAGTHAITASGSNAANYDVTYRPGVLSVAKAALTVSADDKSKVYGGADPLLTASAAGLQYNDTTAVLTGLTLATATGTAATAGTHAITASGSNAANYDVTYRSGVLSVAQAALLVSADNKAKTYGGADPLLTSHVSGFQYDDTAAVLSGLVLNTVTGAAATAGTHAITASGASAANYAVSYQPGVLSVSKAALLVSADNKAKVYGAADPLLTASATGLQYADTTAVLTDLSLTTTTGAAATAGAHPITASGSTAANYDVMYQPGVLSVAKAALLVSADNKAKVYGAADPALTASFAGLQYNDTAGVVTGLALNTTTGAAATAGTHAITASGSTAANYDVTYQPGVLSVAKAALTISADDKAKVYGAADPQLTASIAGLQYSDTASVASGLALTAPTGAAASAGTHAIVGSSATAANYDVAYRPGTLTVAPAVLTYTATPAQVYAGANGAAFTGSVTGFVYGESLATATTGAATFDSAAARPFAVGTYAVTGTGLAAANYRFVQAPANLSALAVLANVVVPPTGPAPVDPLVELASLIVVPEMNRDLNFTTSALYDRNVNGTRVCVGAGSFAAGAGAGDLNDALSLEWSRVRVSPNLSNCFSLGERNGCSDF